jgi:hypothetical protein
MTTRTNWQDREYSSYCSGRYGSAGWEFDTAKKAVEYVNEQYANQRPEHVKDFRAEVRSNGVLVIFTAYGLMRTETYRKPKGGTMRDIVTVPSPSDCEWMIPGTEAQAFCDYYRD